MKISNFLVFTERFKASDYNNNPSPSKEQILEHIGKLYTNGFKEKYKEKDLIFPSEESISKALITRENLVTTGVGYGIALPNAKINGLPVAGFGIYKIPETDWASMDKYPVVIAMPAIAPTDGIGIHLMIMAHLSFMWKNENNRKAILEATDFSRPEIDMKSLIDILDK